MGRQITEKSIMTYVCSLFILSTNKINSVGLLCMYEAVTTIFSGIPQLNKGHP